MVQLGLAEALYWRTLHDHGFHLKVPIAVSEFVRQGQRMAHQFSRTLVVQSRN